MLQFIRVLNILLDGNLTRQIYFVNAYFVMSSRNALETIDNAEQGTGNAASRVTMTTM